MLGFHPALRAPSPTLTVCLRVGRVAWGISPCPQAEGLQDSGRGCWEVPACQQDSSLLGPVRHAVVPVCWGRDRSDLTEVTGQVAAHIPGSCLRAGILHRAGTSWGRWAPPPSPPCLSPGCAGGRAGTAAGPALLCAAWCVGGERGHPGAAAQLRPLQAVQDKAAREVG